MTITNALSYIAPSHSAVSSTVSPNSSSAQGSAAANAAVDKAFTSAFQGGAAVADWDGELCPRIPKKGPPHGPLGGIDLSILSGQMIR